MEAVSVMTPLLFLGILALTMSLWCAYSVGYDHGKEDAERG